MKSSTLQAGYGFSAQIVEPTLSQKLKNKSQLPRKSGAPTFLAKETKRVKPGAARHIVFFNTKSYTGQVLGGLPALARFASRAGVLLESCKEFWPISFSLSTRN
jgi:hypothetical protein